MSHENVALVREGLERFIAGEVLWETLDPDLEVHDHDILDAGEYRGHAGFGRWLSDWGAAWEAFSFEPREFIDAGDRVVAVIHLKARGRSSGVEVERDDAIVYTLRDGKTVRIDYFNNRDDALAAVASADSAGT